MALDELDESAHGTSTNGVVNSAGGGAPVLTEAGLRGGETCHCGDGFFFHVQREVGGRVYLHCINRRRSPACHARGTMNSNRTNLQHDPAHHNHGPDMLYAREMQLRREIVCVARENIGTRLDVLFHRVCQRFDQQVSARVSLNSMRSSMYRAQYEGRPRIPTTFDELHAVLEQDQFRELGATHDGQDRIYGGLAGIEPGTRSLVFSSRRLMQELSRADTIFADGTFFARPSEPQSGQLFVIIVVRDSHIIPVLHALMEGRSFEAYLQLMQFIRDRVPHLNPEHILTDFETALQHALRGCFPGAILNGCLWHYANAVCRNVRRLYLHALVRDNDNARAIVKLCLALPLCPSNRIMEGFEYVQNVAREVNLHQPMFEFLQYVENTWLQRIGTEILSVFGLRHRTNNGVECHNRNLNARVGVRRPNVWRFLDVMRDVEDATWRDVGRANAGVAPARGRRCSVLLNDKRIASCSRQLQNGEMTLPRFLRASAHIMESLMNSGLQNRGDEDRPPSPPRISPHLPVGSILADSVPQEEVVRGEQTTSAMNILPLQQMQHSSTSSGQTGSEKQTPRSATSQAVLVQLTPCSATTTHPVLEQQTPCSGSQSISGSRLGSGFSTFPLEVAL